MSDWPRQLKSVYRQDPVLSFVVTAGIVNVAIGGLSEHWSLLSVGLSVVGVAIALGVRQRFQPRRRRLPQSRRPPRYALPPAETELPLLTLTPKRPPEQ